MEKKKQNVFIIALVTIVIVIDIWSSAIEMIKFILTPEWVFLVCNLSIILTALLLLYYIFIGYKKPHGNLLRYLMLFFAACLILGVLISGDITFNAVLIIISTMLITYMAGRLNKLHQNIIISVIVAILILVSVINLINTYGFMSFHNTYTFFSPFIQWLVFCAAYFVRFKEHKEAGLMDAPKE